MPSEIASYHRVSTEDQNLERQLTSTAEYAQDVFGVGLDGLRIHRDKSTGTNTDRDGYKEMMTAVEDGKFEAVVVHSVSRIARSIRDLDRTVERIVHDSDTELHIVKEGFQLVPGESDPYQTAMLQLLGVFAELEANMAQQRTKEGLATRRRDENYAHGPAPLGFAKDDGALVETDAYDDVVAVLTMVDVGDLSKRKAAERLDTSRTTVRRALDDRRDLYAL